MRYLAIALVFLLLYGCGQNPKKDSNSYTQSDLSAPPENSQEMLNVRMGIGYFERGDTDTAIEKLQKALKINPRLAIAHSALAIVFNSINAQTDARRHYELSVKYAPNDPVVLNNYGTFLCQTGEFKKAVNYYERIINNPFYKNSAGAHENAGVCLMGDDNYESAERHFRQALELNPRMPVSLYNMVIIKAGQKEHLKARAFLQRLESLSPLDKKMLTIAYQIETRLGSVDSANAYRQKLKEMKN